MVAPGTALREGIDAIGQGRLGALICIGDSEELSFLYSGGIKLDIDYTPALLYQLAKMDGAIILNAERHQDLLGQRPADAGPDDPLARDRHASPHRRARVQADRRARDRDLGQPRRGLALPRRREVHPRGHPRRAGQGQPGARHARQVPHPARPGVHAADRPRVRGRRHAARRAHGAAARGDGHPHGRRDRALHRRARHRGPPDRDAARGDDGRRRRRQGRARARLPRRAIRRELRARDRLACRACRTRTCSTSAGSPSCWATTASSTRSTIPVSPRGYRILGRVPRLPKTCRAEPRARVRRPGRDAGRRRRRAGGRRGRRRDMRAKDIREGLRRLQEINLVDRYLQT